ncbi:MAG: hypothetical protein K8R90_01215 [Candidatus Cloacimonetes bacterium]|nr:hypothetical protein [Candidatus Cloacimonadota bacterium]
MKKFATVLMLVILSTMLSGALFADTITTSYDRNAPLLNPSAAMLLEIKAVLAQTGHLTSFERQALDASETVFVAIPQQSNTRDLLTCYPSSVDYWTGTTDGVTRTDVSEVRGLAGEDGWFKFDTSGIPDNATINSVQFNGYVNATYYPYWSLTPLSGDPMTMDVATLHGEINGNSGSGTAYVYQNEGSTYAVGWKQHDMGAQAVTDLQANLGSDWFACGMDSRDNSTSWYVNWDGWNQANVPYIVVDYTPAVTGIGTANAGVAPGTGNTSTMFTYSIDYLHSGGTAPALYNVYINGTPHALTLPGGTPDWTTYQTLTYDTTMPAGMAHEYYFELGDGLRQTVLVPDTAPAVPFYGPDVFTTVPTLVVIDHAGGGDYTTFQDCFNALMNGGTVGPTSVEVTAGTYVEEAVLDAPIAGTNDLVHFYPQVAGSEVIVDGTPAATQAPLYVLNSGNVWFDGFTLQNGANSGVRFEGSNNCHVSNCKLINNGWIGICLSGGSTDVWAWNNFVAWNYTQQIALYDSGTGCNVNVWNNSVYADGAAGAGYMIGLTLSNSEATFWNNAVHRNWHGGSGFSIIHYQNQDWTTHPNTFLDYNVYYTEDGSQVITGYATLADWQASGNGQDANSLYGDPLFTDVAITDLHIPSSPSPCVDNGNAAGAWYTDDYDRDVRGPWDIGADDIEPPAVPVATGGTVDPPVGNELEAFIYSCHLFNPLPGAVTSAEVIIDAGAPIALVYPADPNNGTYTYETTGAALGAGAHDYFFSFVVDGHGTVLYPDTGTEAGPTVDALTYVTLPFTETFEDILPADWTYEVDTQSDIYWDAAANNTTRVDGGMVMVGNSSTGFSTPNTGNVWTLAAPGGSNAAHSAYVYFYGNVATPGPYTLSFDYSMFYQYNNMYTNMRVDINTGSGWTQLGADFRPASGDTGWLAADRALGTLDGAFGIRFWTSIKYNLAGYNTGVFLDNIAVAPPANYVMGASTDNAAKSGWVETDVSYDILIENMGLLDDTYDLTVTGNTWTTVWDAGASIFVAAGANVTTGVTVSIPAGPVAPDVADLVVTSQGDPAVTETVQVTTDYIDGPTSGGPDAAGYSWISSNNASGPAYDWVDPVTRVEMALPGDDATVGPFPLGFDFDFYGNIYNEFYFCSNGFIVFGTAHQSLSNQNLPNTSTPNNLIAWFWDDLDPYDNPDNDTHIYYETVLVGGENACVVTMENYHEYSGGGSGKLTAQVIMFENGDIKLQYQSFDGGIDMNGATVGLENIDGTIGLTYEYNIDYLVPEMAILFNAPIAPPDVFIAMSGDDAVLTWDAVSGAASYHVYYATDPGAGWTEFGDSPVAVPTYTHTGIGATDVKYFYYVTSDDGAR